MDSLKGRPIRTWEMDDLEAAAGLVKAWSAEQDLPLWADGKESALVRIFVGTFNLSCSRPPDDLRPWVSDNADLILLALQETEYDVPEGFDNVDSHLTHLFLETLGRDAFEVVGKTTFRSTSAVCLARKSVAQSTHTLQRSALGLMATPVGSNNEAVALSLFIGDTRICFVSSHLGGSEESTELRNTNFSEASAGLLLGSAVLPLTIQHSLVVWAGGLNYKVHMDAEEAKPLIAKEDWKTLERQDNLRKARKRGQAFVMYKEPSIDFPPTFRYVHGEGPRANGRREYSSTSNRAPSWNDRILTCTQSNTRLELLKGSYKSVQSFATSDHNPVCARFNLHVPNSSRVIVGAESNLKIKVTKVKATGIVKVEGGGKLDSYVLLSSVFASVKAKSATRYDTLDPDWSGEALEIEPLQGINRVAWVQSQNVFLGIYSDSSCGKDELLGAAAVSLHGCGTQPTQFLASLCCDGYNRGQISGEIAVVFVQ